MDVNRIPYIIVAILITIIGGMILGPLAGNANPFIWGAIDKIFGGVGERIDRKNRTRSDLMFRGLLYISIMLILALAIINPLSTLVAKSSLVEGLIVTLCITSGSVWYMVLKLYFAVTQKGKAEGGYFGLSRSSRTDLNSTDDHGVIREGLVFSAVSFDKGLVAPSLWYLFGGVPLLLIYSLIAFTAWRFGKNGFSKGFGVVPLALEKVIGFIPSLFTGFLFTAAATVSPTAKIVQALKSWWQAKGAVPYEQGGVVLSALAWPLEVSLGGPVQDISGSAIKKAWVGPKGASAKVESFHLKRAIIMNVVAHLLYVLALLSTYIYADKAF